MKKPNYGFRDWCFLFGIWWVGRADRGAMGVYLEKAGKAIQRQEGRLPDSTPHTEEKE